MRTMDPQRSVIVSENCCNMVSTLVILLRPVGNMAADTCTREPNAAFTDKHLAALVGAWLPNIHLKNSLDCLTRQGLR